MLEQVLDYERVAFLWLNGGHTPFWDSFIWLYSGKTVWIPAALWILLTICYKKDWKESLLILLAIVLIITLCDQFASSVCKPLFTRFRPTNHPDFREQVQTVYGYRGGRYGFISSHTANAVGFAVFTLLLFRYRWYTVAILIWSVLMAYSRIYLGVHFISDVLPAAVAGVVFGIAGYELYRLVRRKTAKTAEKPPVYTTLQMNLILSSLSLTVVFMLIFSCIKSNL
jgi:undecaprenyl-diphosphatase